MNAALVIGALAVIGMLVIAGDIVRNQGHRAALDALHDSHVAEILHLEDAHERNIELLRNVYERAWEELRLEREQTARLAVSKDSLAYATLRKVERMPEEALGEAERARAEILAGRMPRDRDPSPMLVKEDGEPIIPVGAG